MNAPLIGKGDVSKDSKNVHVINELGIPISILGLSNLNVAASPDGILVSDKEASPRVKEFANQFEERPMYEERRWGWYRILDYTECSKVNKILTKKVCVLANKSTSYQKHILRRQTWTVISGTSLFILNDKIRKVKAGNILEIPARALHAIKAITTLKFIEVQFGSKLTEEDVITIPLK